MTLFFTRDPQVQPTEELLVEPRGAGYVVRALDMDLFDGRWVEAHQLDCANLESARSCVPSWYWRVPPGPGITEAYVYGKEGNS